MRGLFWLEKETQNDHCVFPTYGFLEFISASSFENRHANYLMMSSQLQTVLTSHGRALNWRPFFHDLNPFESINDFGTSLWLTPDNFIRQGETS